MSRRLVAAQLAAAGAAAAGAALRARPPGGATRWARVNHRGEPVSLLEGPAYTLGAVTAIALAPGVSGRVRAAAGLATAGAAGFGAYDDLAGDGSSRGLRGHLGALRRGELSTGAVKILGLGATGLAAAAALAPDLAGKARRRGRGRAARTISGAADVAVAGALVAGSANLINLLDLRPGRALKGVLALGLAATPGGGPAGRVAAAAVGAGAAVLPADLGERSMLGDTGANAAGALLGTAWALRLGPRGRLVALAAVTALTLASERVSFTAVIDRTPLLREVDAWGRRPPDPS